MRVQFYPTERQVEKLTSEAEKQGVSISVSGIQVNLNITENAYKN